MKKIVMLFTVMLCVLCGAIGFVACGESTNSGNTGSGGSQIEQPDDDQNKPHVHSFTNYVYNNDATCTEDGTETATCSCGETNTRTKKRTALGHTFEVYTSNGDATCLENGTETATCIRCAAQDTREEEGSALGHDWDEGQITTPATCTTLGVKTFTCNHDPSHHNTEEIEKLPHQYGEWQDEIPASCTAPGRKGYQECESCHLKYDRTEVLIEENDLTIAQLDHNYEFDHVVKKTCKGAGYVVKKCSMCQGTQNVVTEDISLKAKLTRMSGASFNGYGNFEYTYTAYAEGGYGTLQYRAEFFQSTTNDTPSKVLDYSENAAFTLSWSGYDASDKWKLKVICKDEVGNMTTALFSLKVNDFLFGDFDGNGGANVSADLTCIEQKVDEAHNYQGVKTDPTCTEQGYTTYTCTDCQTDYIGDYTDLLGHDFENGFCKVCHEQEPSDGLIYIPTADGKGYAVAGLGTCQDKDIIIASVYNKMPVTEIGTKAFENEKSIVSVKMPKTITLIKKEAFFCCDLAEITIGSGVTSIGDYAFEGCSGLTSVIIPDSVTEIGQSAFWGCSGLTGELKIPDNVTKIESGAFRYCRGLTSVTIGSSVTLIGWNAFSECTKLISVTIPDSVTSIEYKAFYGCSGLTSIIIPDSVTSIGERAFYDCEGLTSVTIGSGVTYIGSYAFSSCTKLTSVIFQDPNGWSCGSTKMDATLLQDPAVAAVYLTKTYSDTKWTKTKTN